MKQNLYTCCRCAREQRTAVDIDTAPLGWAAVSYQCDHVDTIEGSRQLVRTALTTHACSDCCDEVLAFLEKETPERSGVDLAFDDGGTV